MDELTQTPDNEHWCFVSYQYLVEKDYTPRFGNITLPMTGRITNDEGVKVLFEAVKQSLEKDLADHNIKLEGVPIILYFKELGV